jgi:hypothetical protein
MYLLLFVLMLIILYVISNQKSKTLTYALGLLAVILIVCANTHEHIEAFTDLGYAPLSKYQMGPMDGLNVEQKYDINNQQTASYSGLVLNSSTHNKNHELLPIVKHVSNVGEEIPLTNDPVSYSFPTVDGKPNSNKKMFMFAHNKSSLACCPSTYSDDRGCVCTTPQQRNFINTRGGNKTTGKFHDF